MTKNSTTRLLIGYEHARCNTNTDVILPVGVPIDPTDFEPTAIQLAEQHKPMCPICFTLMDFAIWGPHDDDEIEPASPRLTFGELAPGDHFIGFPIPGDDSGHGGYLGAERLFVKTRAFAPPIYENSGLAASERSVSVFPNTMHVIKVQGGSVNVPSKHSNPDARRWRDSGVAWFWSNDREDFGRVVLEKGRYDATTVRGSASFETLTDAKEFVEEHSS